MPSCFMNFFKMEFEEEKMKLLRDRRTPKVKKIANHQVGKSDKKRDKVRKALPPGKRISKTGRKYYETRRNRSDSIGELI